MVFRMYIIVHLYQWQSFDSMPSFSSPQEVMMENKFMKCVQSGLKHEFLFKVMSTVMNKVYITKSIHWISLIVGLCPMSETFS